MMLVELAGIPMHVHRQIRKQLQRHVDVTIDVLRSRKNRVTRVFLKETPKGWWLALRIMTKGPSKLYRLVEISEVDVPSALLEASLKNRWTPELERRVAKALEEWGGASG